MFANCKYFKAYEILFFFNLIPEIIEQILFIEFKSDSRPKSLKETVCASFRMFMITVLHDSF